ncbi:MAG: FAD:protein FMN transferase [Bacteroidales bacterium]|nr:FAD:protein FMN transferase [Bacteroidales bacterium]
MSSDTIFGYIFRLFSAAVILTSVSCAPRDRYVSFTGFAQGGTYSVQFNMNGRDGMIKERVQTVRDSVDAILGAIDRSLSGYNRNSLLSRFNEGLTIRPDSLFIDIYDRSYDIYESTAGVVDVASAPLFDIWGFGFKNGQIPDDELVARTMAGCGMRRLRKDMRAYLTESGELDPRRLLDENATGTVALNYNAVAQGYSCDVVARYLYSLGVKDMMVNIGEIYCDGLNPSGKAWTIGIDKPVDGNNDPGVQLQGVFSVPSGPHGVVTSGNYRKFYVSDGRKYAHTIDPRTGRPVTHNLLSATVIAPDATLADAYATYCMVVGLDQAVAFIESSPDLEACLIYDDNGQFRTWTSTGLSLN